VYDCSAPVELNVVGVARPNAEAGSPSAAIVAAANPALNRDLVGLLPSRGRLEKSRWASAAMDARLVGDERQHGRCVSLRVVTASSFRIPLLASSVLVGCSRREPSHHPSRLSSAAVRIPVHLRDDPAQP
jgi:hypothetical protein